MWFYLLSGIVGGLVTFGSLAFFSWVSDMMAEARYKKKSILERIEALEASAKGR